MSLSFGLFYIEIVVVHYGFLAMFPHGFTRLFGVAIGFAHTHCISCMVDDAHNVVFLKSAPYIGDAYGEDADCLVGSQYLGGAFVDVQFAFGETFAVGYPFLDAGYGFGRGWSAAW